MNSWFLRRSRAPWLAAGVAGVLLLSGCGGLPLPKAPQPVVRYDLGLMAPPVPAAAAPTAPLMPVAVGAVRAPLQAQGSTALHYRLAYEQAQVQHAYAHARWSLPPAQLVQQRLREHLGQGGRAVLSAEPGDVAPSVQGQQVWVLQLWLEEFSHVFSTPQDSVGWVRVRASLVDPAAQGDVLLAQQVLEVRQPASAANAAAGVQALSQAVDSIGQQLQQWLAQVSAAAPAR